MADITLRSKLEAATASTKAEWADRLAAVAHLSWRSPERFAVENAYDNARADALDAVRNAHAAAQRAELDPGACTKCDGAGQIAAFSHIHEGLCFACNGTGRAR